MAYVHVAYDSIRDLVDQFQTLGLLRDAALPGATSRQPNFVMVEPVKYYGCYGGLVRDSVMQQYALPLRDTHSVHDSIGYGYNIVWWNTCNPPFQGDLFALTAEGRVAVTPSMFESMRINTIRVHKKPVSSYYTTKAWRMNDASSNNWDSE